MNIDSVYIFNRADRTTLKLPYFCLTVSLFLFSNALYAEWFLGADIIPSTDFYQLNSLVTDDGLSASRSNYREDELKVFSGFKTSDRFLVGLEYRNNLDFGTPNALETQNLLSGSLINERFNNNALFLSGQRTFIVDDGKYLYLRGGLYNWDINTSDLAFTEEQSFDRRGTDVFYSIGAAFDFSETFGVRAEWERFTIDEEDLDVISTELRFNF